MVTAASALSGQNDDLLLNILFEHTKHLEAVFVTSQLL